MTAVDISVCGNCRFWRVDNNTPPQQGDYGSYQVGWCYRYPPISQTPDVKSRYWPLTYDGDWCGEWQFIT